jgi:transcriptional regulator with XRE-family HTH domain
MISPYVRRKRLAAELRALREASGLTHAQLGKAIGQSRTKISRLENGHIRPDQAEIMKILDALSVDGEKWMKIITIAREAAERGWWESYNESMGERQALYANLEAGAISIREYQQTFIPGLLQTPEFTSVRMDVDGTGDAEYTLAGVVEARIQRQRMLRRPNGPTYDVILDEVAVRRLTAPPNVMRAQLHELVKLTQNTGKITVRLLPVDAQIAGYLSPRSAFSVYAFSDPEDPTVIAVDTVTSDLIVTQPDEVARYVELYDRLSDAALSATESLDFLTTVSEHLPDS